MNLIQITNNQNYGLVVSSRVVAKNLKKDVEDVKKKIRKVLECRTEYFPVQIQNRGKEAESILLWAIKNELQRNINNFTAQVFDVAIS